VTATTHDHAYRTVVTWTGNDGTGTANYRAYRRDHDIGAPGKTAIAGSSDPKFRGDATRYNPEELLVASLSSCHMLWYLHLCAVSGIVVTAYVDEATGAMTEEKDGSGQFTAVVLHPRVEVAQGSDIELAERLHERAHEMCFIARSVNFPVECEPRIVETREPR